MHRIAGKPFLPVWIRDFINLLNIVYQNPGVKAQELLESGSFGFSGSMEPGEQEPQDEFSEFEI